MIEVRDLVRKYGDAAAVDGISFDVSPREVLGFLGPNGAGKTTTLKVLTGYLSPTSGRVSIDGRDVAEDALASRRAIGYLPENNPLYEDMEVTEYLEWCGRVRGLGPERLRQAMKSAIARCGLGPVAGKDIGRLSKGFRQRVGLAAAILHDPPILLLDEPTSGLDPNQAAEVRGLIAELRREKTLMLSSHILSEVRATCDRVIIIHKGRIAAQGSPEELAASASGRERVRLVLKAAVDSEAVRRDLQALPGAVSVDIERRGEELTFSCEAEAGAADLRGLVFAGAVDKNWPLLELWRERASLEDVFRSLTR